MCLVCGNNSHRATVYGGYSYSGSTYSIVRCRRCGFMYLDPSPSPRVLDALYSDDGYFADYFIPGSDKLGYCQGNYEHNEHHSRALAALALFTSSARILDIGCAGGGFLIQAKRAGYDVAGVEPNSRMAELARSKTQARIITGSFADGLFPQASFDVVHLGDVLEHLPDPQGALRAIRRILTARGLVVVEQPLTYNASLFNLFLRACMLFKRKRYSGNPPAHLWEFSPLTLRRFLEKNGYSVLWSSVYENRAKPLFVYKNATLKNRISRVIKNMSAFVSNSPLLKKLELGDRMIVICRKNPDPGKPRILYVHPNLKVGGAETNRLNVLKYMNRYKYDITVCCLTEKGGVARQLESLGFPVDCLGVSGRSYDIRTTVALYRYMKKNKFSIVHTCLSTTNLHGRIAARLAGVPVIISEDQSEYERYNARLGFIFRALNRFLARFTDRIIVCSRKTGEVIAQEEKIPRDKFIVLHNVIDTASFKPERSAGEVRRELGLGQSDVVIGYVGSLAHRKGHMHLLHAFRMLSALRPELRLVLVGDGPLKRQLKEWAVTNGLGTKIVFAGQRMDIPDMLSVMTIFVSPALAEAFGIVMIEAMFMGLPVVATRVGGVPEVIDENETGILVPPADPQALTDAVSALLRDPDKRSTMGAAGRRRVSERFSAQTYASRLDELYGGLMVQKS